MHQQIHMWVEYVKHLCPPYFSGGRILDVGSLDINGNVRGYFSKGTYIGLDVGPGPNVDVVSVCHEYQEPDESFSVVISCDALEHDMYWMRTLDKMHRLLKPGGLMILTCASEGRGVHGTAETGPAASPNTIGKSKEWSNYYRNLLESDVRAAMQVTEIFRCWEFSSLFVSGWGTDLRFWGIKKG